MTRGPRVRCGWLATLLIIFGSSASGQPLIDHWTTENGLPQNSVYDIVQTRDGYLWLATHGGIVRFDGLRFVVFDRSVEGIESLRIRALLEAADGTLWAGTEDGMLIRNRAGQFASFGREHGLPEAGAARIEEDEDGHLWIWWRAPWNDTITRYDGRRFTTYQRAELMAGSLVIVPGTTGRERHEAWWHHDAEGLLCFVNGRVEACLSGADVPPGSVAGVSIDTSGTRWVRLRDGAVIRDRDGAIQTFHPVASGGGPSMSGLFHEDADGALWYVGELGGLSKLVRGAAEAVSPLRVADLLEDREGSMWVGTMGGLLRVREAATTLYTVQDGLSVDAVYSILQDRTGAIWIGTWDGGLNRLDGGRTTRFDTSHGLPSFRISSIHEDRSGQLWVGTQLGLARWHDGGFRPVHDTDGYLAGPVWAILEAPDGAFYYGTDGGLVEAREGRLRRYGTADGLSHDRVFSLARDRSGVVWIGGPRGVTRLEQGRFLPRAGADTAFDGHVIRAFYEDADGVMWVGTYDGGLYRVKDGRTSRITTREGLHDNGVFQILEDDQGHLWMGSNRGIQRISREALNDLAEGRTSAVTPLVLSSRDGLASIECNGGRQPAGLKTADGRLWFPTMGGVAIVDPSRLGEGVAPAPVIIEELRAGRALVGLSGAVTLPPDHNTFDIRFTAPSFVRPEFVRFRYRLEGLEQEWTETRDVRAVTYHRIPPGRYSFVVMASSGDGVWGTAGTRLPVTVLAPFWRQPWFAASAGIGLVALLYAAHATRVRRLCAEHDRQQAFSQQLIEAQENERHRISTDMHDSLGHDLQIIKRQARSLAEELADAAGATSRLDAITDVAERAHAGMKEMAYGLRPYPLDKVGLSRTIDGMIARVADATAIEVRAELEDVDALLTDRAQVAVFRIVQEALNNVVTHAGASRVSVRVTNGHDTVHVEVEDDGEGFTLGPDRTAHATKSSFGLMGIRARATSIGGETTVRSRPGRGTIVTVTIPVDRDAHAG